MFVRLSGFMDSFRGQSHTKKTPAFRRGLAFGFYRECGLLGEFLQIDIGDVAEAVLAPRERGQFLKPRMQLLLGGIKERELPLQSVDGVFRQFPRGILRRQIPARPGMIERPV